MTELIDQAYAIPLYELAGVFATSGKVQGLVMDVKCGNGAFADTPEMALALAQSLVEVANGAGLPTRAGSRRKRAASCSMAGG